KRLVRPPEGLRRPDGMLFQPSAGHRQLDGEDGIALHACLVPPYALSLGTSSHLRCRQLFRPSSASCTPFAPSSRSQRKRLSSPATWRRKSSHCALKALS